MMKMWEGGGEFGPGTVRPRDFIHHQESGEAEVGSAHTHCGFTLVELLVVLVLMANLSLAMFGNADMAKLRASSQ